MPGQLGWHAIVMFFFKIQEKNIHKKRLFGVTIIPEKRCLYKNVLAGRGHCSTPTLSSQDVSFPAAINASTTSQWNHIVTLV